LPLAVQLIGRRDGEAELFRVAAWCEDVLRKAAPADQLAGG
jgi:Asp-tRNA(Asn)/Glu-tRNA(Gln) amidotransferase A subunit family amidase